MVNPYEDSAQEFRDLVWGIMFEIGSPSMSDFFPVLKRLELQGVKRRIIRHFTDLLKMLEGLISERLELNRSGIYVENTVALDELIKVCQENPDYEIDTTQMAHLFVDVFGAGTDTTWSTLEWCMAEVMKSTETMVKAKAELIHVLGHGKMLEEADIHQLPYLRCIVITPSFTVTTPNK
ncbi:hypothetical protein AgCh_027516 [Apium graveolens]